jgi:hypothetical protein
MARLRAPSSTTTGKAPNQISFINTVQLSQAFQGPPHMSLAAKLEPASASHLASINSMRRAFGTSQFRSSTFG